VELADEDSSEGEGDGEFYEVKKDRRPHFR
jgi:hypothetical protein